MIHESIKNDLSKAIKDRSSEKEFIKVVLAEFSRKGKDLSDEASLKILKEIRKNSEIMNNSDEMAYLDKYLPKLMSEDEIKEIIAVSRFNGVSTLPEIMKIFNTIYKGKADNSLVSKFAKELLK